jgi:hypothetical protein
MEMSYDDTAVSKSGPYCQSTAVTNNLAANPAVEAIDLAAIKLAAGVFTDFE